MTSDQESFKLFRLVIALQGLLFDMPLDGTIFIHLSAALTRDIKIISLSAAFFLRCFTIRRALIVTRFVLFICKLLVNHIFSASEWKNCKGSRLNWWFFRGRGRRHCSSSIVNAAHGRRDQ